MPGSTDITAVVSPLAERYKALLDVEVLPASTALARRYGASDGRLYLVRPDGYVASKATAADAGPLDAYLAGVARG